MLLVGLAAGASVAWWLRGRELVAERERAAALAAAERAAHDQRVAALTTLRGEFEQTVKGLAADALAGRQKSFLQLADQVFAKHRDGAAATLEQRQKEIAALLEPINTNLKEYKQGLGEIEKARAAAYGGLSEEMKALALMQADPRAEARQHVNPLQAAPETPGRRGEHQLHNVMELSGMAAHVYFLTEETIGGGD